MSLNKTIRKAKKEKGFSLIELLVVVAIIGILAAVGVVAYTGYTKKAKINSLATQHAAIAKFVAAEFQKCNLGDSTICVSGTGDAAASVNCSGIASATDVASDCAAVLDATFKNAYEGSKSAFSDITGDTKCTATNSGCHTITYSSKVATITSYHEDPDDASKTKTLTTAVAAD